MQTQLQLYIYIYMCVKDVGRLQLCIHFTCDWKIRIYRSRHSFAIKLKFNRIETMHRKVCASPLIRREISFSFKQPVTALTSFLIGGASLGEDWHHDQEQARVPTIFYLRDLIYLPSVILFLIIFPVIFLRSTFIEFSSQNQTNSGINNTKMFYTYKQHCSINILALSRVR